VKSGVLARRGRSVHWARKDSWRRVAPTPAREAELNWRSRRSPRRPDGRGGHPPARPRRRVPPRPARGRDRVRHDRALEGRPRRADTRQCVLEYPGGVRVAVEATLASSVGGAHTLVRGSNSSLMLREKRAWLLKEADSPLLGWEVYAHKDNVLEGERHRPRRRLHEDPRRGQEPGSRRSSPHASRCGWPSRTSWPPCAGARAGVRSARGLPGHRGGPAGEAAVRAGPRVAIPRTRWSRVTPCTRSWRST
jgi:hypothetical protein